MRSLYTWILLLLLSSVTACSNMGGYKAPSRGDQNAASITGGVEDRGVINWRRIVITMIDNKTVAGLKRNGLSRFLITPGPHVITAEPSFRNGYWANGKHAYVDIPFTAEPRQAYELHSTVIGAKINVWISTLSGKRSSEVVSIYYNDLPPK